MLEESPSLHPKLEQIVRAAYADVVKPTALAMSRNPSEFPPECPYTVQQLLDESYLPE